MEGLSPESLVTRRPAGHILPWRWLLLPLLFGSLCPVLSLIHLSAAHHAMWRCLVTGSQWASYLFIYARIVEGMSYFSEPHFWFILHLRKAKQECIYSYKPVSSGSASLLLKCVRVFS